MGYRNWRVYRAVKDQAVKGSQRVVSWGGEQLFNHDSALRLQALMEGAAYARDRMQGALATPLKDAVRRHALEHAPADGLVLEFGVWSGRTINLIADTLGPSRPVHGFDSFEGLPEDWFGRYGRGAFHTSGALPEVRPSVELHVGWFDKTLPGFAGAHPGKVGFLHVDCDLYSSTKTIFDHLGDRLEPGSIIVFDEYFNYPGWREHEFKAFQELVAARSLSYRYLAYNTTEMNVAVQIT